MDKNNNIRNNNIRNNNIRNNNIRNNNIRNNNIRNNNIRNNNLKHIYIHINAQVYNIKKTYKTAQKKKSNVRKSRSFKKRRNAMRGGNFDELIKFLTHEQTVLHDHFSKSTGLDRIVPTNIFNKFKSNEITKDELLKQLKERMEIDLSYQGRVRVFTPTPTYYQRDYDDALVMANHNMKNNPAVWKEMMKSYKVSNPEQYATAIANEKLIERKQPRAASMPFQQPPVDGLSPYNSGSTVTILGNTGTLVQSGSAFDNWNTQSDGSGTGYLPGNTFTINVNIILYAVWLPL
jgi:hypothetical protein